MKPKCLEGEFLAWSAAGHLLPCCWYDNQNKKFIPQLLQEKFRLSKDNTVEDVLNSEEWKDFLDKVKRDDKSLPPICHMYCG